MTHDNPLLQDWHGAWAVPPFESVQPTHFEPAFDVAMKEHRDELDAIANDAAPASFDNTLAAFDRSGARLSRIEALFSNLCHSHTNPELQAVQRRMAVPLAAHESAIYMHRKLFARVQAVHETRQKAGLSSQQLRLLERVHLDFVRAGAMLAPAAQERYKEVTQKLAELTTAFGQNVLHDESTWQLVLKTEGELAGLPEFVRSAARSAAQERGIEGYAITLSRSLIVPFLTFSQRRDLRETAWRAWAARGEHAGEHDNRPLIAQIIELRQEQAQLHGYKSFADYALVDRMAREPKAVHQLLDDVWDRAKQKVESERAQLKAAQAADGATGEIESWDWRYWAEKVRQRDYAIDDAQVKPYFALEAMVNAAFDTAQRLFGIRFTPRPDLPAYHPDVKVYEVHDAQGGPVGLFFHDNYARPSKRSGAWMSTFLRQGRNGGTLRPLVANNNNFAKGAPTLLSFDDVRTLFHEFGHGLHGLLSNVDYVKLSCTSVLQDFVELPSQLFEHWMSEPEVLRRHARHVQTGEPIPDALIDKLQRAAKFGQGYETVSYVASALVDMAVHTHPDPASVTDWSAFEAQVLRELRLPPAVDTRHRLVHFQHLFSGDAYAAGYYVYMWAEVLDADAFGAFKEAGNPFDAQVAARLKQWIYSSGNSVEPGEAYASFRGRAPKVEALLEKRGLLQPA
ncbi:M3 family metallopeptidase [Ramlibacter sp. PS4R-6]|uniref:M3 family metallopeptidase n=1 Tax=Ramlibacter sp. PS4R-6 TaxID=3133438 RepID=UPI00309B50F2